MAGETIKSKAVCIRIVPWSRTSHIVNWLTRSGKVQTVVKGAVRPKSAFLGQYDLNYTCEIVYYARSRGDLHALRECVPTALRDGLREDWRKLLLAEHFRLVADELAPTGPDANAWFDLLDRALTRLENCPRSPVGNLQQLLDYELKALELAGNSPKIAIETKGLILRGERSIPISQEVASCLRDPFAEKNLQILLDSARVIGVFYIFHLDSAAEGRRTTLRLISQIEQGTGVKDG